MRKSWLILTIAVVMACLSAITGCGSGSGDSGAATWWGGGGDSSQTYSVSGMLRDAITDSPVQGAACTLLQTRSGNLIEDLLKIPRETVTAGTATTDQDGQYRFTGISSGTYTLRFTRTDYVTLEVIDLSVASDTSNVDKAIVQTAQWNQVAGSDAPYDAARNYIIVDASLPSKDARGTSGVVATITPSTGVKIGYFTDATPSTIDWNATGTYQNGRIIFYGLTPGTQYTITFALAGYTFPALSVSTPAGGGVVQNYNIYATSPTPTPTTPTPSPTTPTPSPTPTTSPTPTSSPGGGGGGGGGTTTLHITDITPSKDDNASNSQVNFTVKGSGFGASQGSVSFAPTDFVSLGGAGFSAGAAGYTSLAFNNGVPYVAYRDAGNGNRATVMKYTGSGQTGWENVGGAGFSAGDALYTSLAFYNGVPYVAYQDVGNGNGATVMKYTGSGQTGWENVGGAGFSAGQADYTSLAFYNGVPYVAYRDGSTLANKATVMKLNGAGNGWENVGGAGFSAGQAYYTSLAFNNGVPYVAYRDGGNVNKATVMRLNGAGNGWENVGGAGFSAGQADYISLAFSNGFPCVAYMDGGNGNKATVSTMNRFAGAVTGWSDGEIAGTVSLSLGKYLVSVTAGGATTTEQVYLYKGLYWNNVGTAGFSADEAANTSLAFSNGVPYVAYKDGGNGYKATVMKLNAAGNGWESVGGAGFSAGQVAYTSLAFNNGVPYVAYRDVSTANKGATVMKLNGAGNGWENVGGVGFSAGDASEISLAFNNGVPYVAYRDGSTVDKKATVMKYTGSGQTGWENVGSANFSGNQASSTSLVFDNGVPYVACQDFFTGPGKATVWKYTGSGPTGWEAVGGAGFSAGLTGSTSLAFNNGVPYVAYTDGGNGSKATVMKLNSAGDGWENVGGTGFSAGQVAYTSLAFSNGVPYVAYKDYSTANKGATVMKLNGVGNGWENVGNAGFSTDAADYISFAFNDGVPYVAFKDSGYSSKATVMKCSYK